MLMSWFTRTGRNRLRTRDTRNGSARLRAARNLLRFLSWCSTVSCAWSRTRAFSILRPPASRRSGFWALFSSGRTAAFCGRDRVTGGSFGKCAKKRSCEASWSRTRRMQLWRSRRGASGLAPIPILRASHRSFGGSTCELVEAIRLLNRQIHRIRGGAVGGELDSHIPLPGQRAGQLNIHLIQTREAPLRPRILDGKVVSVDGHFHSRCSRGLEAGAEQK